LSYALPVDLRSILELLVGGIFYHGVIGDLQCGTQASMKMYFMSRNGKRSRSFGSYLAALPIHAKSGREWEPESAAKFTDLSG